MTASARAGVTDGMLFLGWTVDTRLWIDELGTWPAVSYQPVGSLAPATGRGAVAYLPVRLASIPALFHGPFAPAVAIVPAVRRGAGFAFTESVGYADTAARQADAVIVEVVDRPDLGGPVVEGHIVAVLEGGTPPVPPADRRPNGTDERIAGLAAALVPAGATIQYGLGRLPEAVVRHIGTPVSVMSGLVTDAVAELHERGLLAGDVLASYAWGGDRLLDLVATGRVRPVGLETLHEDGRLTATPRFVSINTAVEVGLDGAVNVERARGRFVAGLGGHADYCAAASRSVGGLSLIVLPSTHAGRSSIVRSPSVVSTPRSDVHVVVTEHGVADLRGLDEDGRRRALLAVADPAHRDELASADPT
jgi:acyl-CoA hydrolase